MNAPIVTVITVCRNARTDLLRTESSIRSQADASLEWIIVDGDSTDGTKSYLESLDEPWIKWVSEPDEGIYDAMNKGIRMARGQWLWFLNAGDVFNGESSVAQVMQAPSNADICFGEVIIESEGNPLGTRSEVTPHTLPGTLEKRQFRHGMVVSHQAFIARRELAPFYDSARFQLSADLDWMLNILSGNRQSCQLGTLARVPRDGATRQYWKKSQWERFNVLRKHFGTLPTILNHIYIILRRMRYLLTKRRLR
jgi:glycosyltransferase involved in cell wall biosynthesis